MAALGLPGLALAAALSVALAGAAAGQAPPPSTERPCPSPTPLPFTSNVPIRPLPERQAAVTRAMRAGVALMDAVGCTPLDASALPPGITAPHFGAVGGGRPSSRNLGAIVLAAPIAPGGMQSATVTWSASYADPDSAETEDAGARAAGLRYTGPLQTLALADVATLVTCGPLEPPVTACSASVQNLSISVVRADALEVSPLNVDVTARGTDLDQALALVRLGIAHLARAAEGLNAQASATGLPTATSVPTATSTPAPTATPTPTAATTPAPLDGGS
jgi:hypothetical protein